MDDPRRQIWPIFVEETREHLQQAGDCLLALEQPVEGRAPGQLGKLQRALHSMKGGAGSLGFSAFERLAHALEDALARQPAEPVLPRALVDAVLDGMRLLEGIVKGVEVGVGEQEPPEYARVLASLGGPPAPAPAPTTSSFDPAAHELWPVFRGDVADAMSLLGEAVRARTTAPDHPELVRLRELSDTIEQSGTTLGLPALAQLGREVRGELDAAWSAQTPKAIAERLSTLERCVAQLDEHVEQVAPSAPTPPRPAPLAASRQQLDSFFSECAALLTSLERTMGAMMTPDADRRAAAHQELQQLTHRLKGTTGAVLSGRPAELAVDLHRAAAELGRGGVEGAMTSARFAGVLVAFKEAFQASRAQAAAPAPSAPPPPAKPAEPARPGEAIDSVIRVSRNAVEALTDVLDRAAMSRARRETQLRSLLDLRSLTQEALLWAERAGSELRMLEVQTPMLSGARDRLRDLSTGLKQVSAALWRDLESERIQGAQLKDTLRELRTVPANTLGELLRRTARDTAGRVGKNVRLELVGAELRLDRRIVDAVRDPLLHLLRNAVDHGIEAPQTRLQRGKEAEGRLTLSVEQRGGHVVFSLADDGNGLDLARIRERALTRGLHDARTLEAMSEAEVARLIFLPGFSTAATITEVSGRGVGLDVVEASAVALGGSVSVEHRPGKGSTFRLEVPRALGAVLGLVVKVGSQDLVVPNDAVVRLLRLTHRELTVVGGRPMAKVGDELLPFVSLARLLGLPGARLPLEGGDPVVTVVLGGATGEVAFGVDELVDHQELVVHGLGKHLKDTRHYAGATQLSDGTVVPVLQANELVLLASKSAAAAEAKRASILVADDSLSTRAAIRSILEIAGFDVLTAGDGEEAWALMQAHEVALLITDLQMPRLDGLGLVRRVRADARWEEFPVVVVTAQDSADERAIGLEAGADAWLVKRDIERGALLERVRQLLVVDP